MRENVPVFAPRSHSRLGRRVEVCLSTKLFLRSKSLSSYECVSEYWDQSELGGPYDSPSTSRIRLSSRARSVTLGCLRLDTEPCASAPRRRIRRSAFAGNHT